MITLASRPNPAGTYTAAMSRVAALEAVQRPLLSADAVVRCRTQGRRVEHAIVLMHGYTSCPVQFDALGEVFLERGYNVLIMPLPHHGLLVRSGRSDARLTAEELTSYAEQSLDIAIGLGEHRTVLGLSAGGTLAAWAAQYRADVDLAVPIAPTFGYRRIPTALTRPVATAFRLLPNFFTWWNRLPESDPRSRYMYPNFASRVLAELMRLGFAVSSAARRTPPAAGRIVMVLNGNEPSINNGMARRVARLWRRKTGNVTIYEFDRALGLPHDVIDPLHPQQQTAVVYPILADLLAGRAARQ